MCVSAFLIHSFWASKSRLHTTVHRMLCKAAGVLSSQSCAAVMIQPAARSVCAGPKKNRTQRWGIESEHLSSSHFLWKVADWIRKRGIISLCGHLFLLRTHQFIRQKSGGVFEQWTAQNSLFISCSMKGSFNSPSLLSTIEKWCSCNPFSCKSTVQTGAHAQLRRAAEAAVAYLLAFWITE